MEQIIVEWYSHETNEIMETEVRCFGLIEAIEIVRSSNNYKDAVKKLYSKFGLI